MWTIPGEVSFIKWLQSSNDVNHVNPMHQSKNEEKLDCFSQPWLVKVAAVCRCLVTDESIFILTPLLVWTFQERIMFLPFALTINEILNGWIKWCVQRPRPYWVEAGVVNPIKKQEIDFSFPSSHAQISSCFATALILEFGWNYATKFFVAMAALVALSRCVLGVHYPSCVLAGAGLGALLTYALDYYEILDWFMDDLTKVQKLLFLSVVVVTVLSTFCVIRTIFPEDKSLIQCYKLKTKRLPCEVCVRRCSKYYFQLFSFFGSGIGCIPMMHDNENLTLKFPVRGLTVTEIMESPLLWWRLLLLGIPVLAALFAFAFIIPKALETRDNRRLGSCSKVLGSLLLGCWVTYGCPKAAWYLSWEDPLMTCPVEELRHSDSETFLDYHWQTRRKGECHLKAFNHTEGSAQYQVVTRYATNVGEIQDLVADARRDGKVLRIVGAGWSTNANFEKNEKTIFASLIGDLQGYRKVEPAGSGDRPLVIAGAGIFLGGRQWFSDDISNVSLNVKWEDSLVHKLWLDGLALPTVPDAIGMTLGGLVITGADGWAFGHAKKESLSSVVVGMRYVDGLGNLREVWRNSTDKDEFQAFGASFGLAGVLYEVILSPIDAYCVELKGSIVPGTGCVSSGQKLPQVHWNGAFQSGIEKDHVLEVLEKRLVTPSGFAQSGEVVCGNQPPLQSLQRLYQDNDFPMLSFPFPYTTEEADFVSEALILSTRWVGQESCQSAQDMCGDNAISKLLREKLAAIPEGLNERHFTAFETCMRSLVEGKALKAAGTRPDYQKGWYSKNILDSCYGKLLGTFGFLKRGLSKGVYRYYETAFMHRLIFFHSLNDMEFYFPLDRNDMSAEDIICQTKKVFDDAKGYELYDQQIYDFYFTNHNDDFWMNPEGASNDDPSSSETQSKVLRVNMYISWIRSEVMHDAFELFLDHFNKLNATYTLNWAKVLPRKASHVERILRNYPRFEEWKAFVRSRDPEGIFLSDYWRRIFFPGTTTTEEITPNLTCKEEM